MKVLKTACLAFLLAGAWSCGNGNAPETHDTRPAESAGSQEYDDHAGEAVIHLNAAAQEHLGLELDVAAPGKLEITVELPGEVQINGDKMAHVGPRVGGVVRQVRVSLGQAVAKGELLAVLESRELADSKTAYLAAAERKQLAEATFQREESLWHRKISAEQDYLDARTTLAEANISLRSARQKLNALGIHNAELDQLRKEPDTSYTTYRITAPFDGEVIDRHITIGEPIPALTPVFTIADLSTVWIDLRVHLKDLSHVEAGDRVHLRAAHDGIEEMGTIHFVQPLLGEETRTALARVILPNPKRLFKPGMFVSADVISDEIEVGVRVPRSALIRMDNGDEVVFVESSAGFKPHTVTLGRCTAEYVDVVAGLEVGMRYVASGGFSLKAELSKESFGDEHGH